MELNEIERVDKRRAAAHEAGHLTVAIAESKPAEANIFRNDAAKTDEPIWSGETTFHAKTNPKIAAAGIVGEWWDQFGSMDATEIIDSLSLGMLAFSESDSRGIESEDGYSAAIEGAIEILKTHERFFRWAVLELVNSECVTDGMAWEMFHQAD